MKAITLNATKAGMTRLREKGGASPETLYELTNAYVNASKAPKQRPGTTFQFTWPADTKGLCSHEGVLYAFSAGIVDTGSATHKVVTLRHPDTEFAGKLLDIHFAQAFLGYLYVVAEFDDNAIFHYWLREPETWVASHAYTAGESVQPTTPNGYYYEATTELTPPAWAPGVPREVGDVIQPTEATGWKYTVTAVTGDNPVSGSVEPTWPETPDATVTEYVEADPPPPPPAAPPPASDDPNDGRYDNPGGSGGWGPPGGPGPGKGPPYQIR